MTPMEAVTHSSRTTLSAHTHGSDHEGREFLLESNVGDTVVVHCVWIYHILYPNVIAVWVSFYSYLDRIVLTSFGVASSNSEEKLIFNI